MRYRCTKSLFKSTYQKNAFTKRRYYSVVEEDEKFVWLQDNEGESRNFSKQRGSHFYYILDYMEKP